MGFIPGCLPINGATYTVTQLGIEFRKYTGVEGTCFRYVPDCSSLNNVPNDELLNGLALGHTPGASHAANWLHMAGALYTL